MKKIVITLELKKEIPKKAEKDLPAAVLGYVEHGTFLEGMEDAISCGDCLQLVSGIKKMKVELK